MKDTTKMLKFVKLSANAVTPTKGEIKLNDDNLIINLVHFPLLLSGSQLSAGYDLYSAETLTVPSRGKAVAKTDLQIKVPEGTYGRVAPR